MKRWFSALLILPVIGFALQACGPKFKDQPDCGFVKNAYGERISWKSDSLIELSLHKSIPAEMIPAIEAAIHVWELAEGRPLFRITNRNVEGPLSPRQDGTNVIYWMNTWEAEKASEQARTSVYWVGDRIREADIRINDKKFDFYVTEAAKDKDIHLESLLVHELGHVLGMRHKDDAPSVMATYLASNTLRDKLSNSDKENLKCEY